jgi:hypothetical protein
MPNEATIVGVAGVIHDQIVALARANPGCRRMTVQDRDYVDEPSEKTVDNHLLISQGGSP